MNIYIYILFSIHFFCPKKKKKLHREWKKAHITTNFSSSIWSNVLNFFPKIRCSFFPDEFPWASLRNVTLIPYTTTIVQTSFKLLQPGTFKIYFHKIREKERERKRKTEETNLHTKKRKKCSSQLQLTERIKSGLKKDLVKKKYR